MFSFLIKMMLVCFLLCLTFKKSFSKTITFNNKPIIEFNINDTNEYWNVKNSYVGQTIISLDFKNDLTKIGGFYISGDNNRGTTITNNYIGTYNTVSSIENKKTNKLYELYYYKQIKNLYIKIGKFDLQNNFGSDEQFSYFINTSSTSSSIFSNNTYEMSNYGPVSSLGIYSEYNYKNFTFKEALVSDNPFKINNDISNSKTDRYGNSFKIESPMLLLETNMNFGNSYKTYISLGGFIDFGKQSITYDTIFHKKDASFYFSLEQDVFNNKNNNLQFIVRYMRDPYIDRTIITSTFDSGILYKHKNNSLGFLFGYELGDRNMFTTKPKLQYKFELTYRYNISNNLYIQPDLQFISNISGYNKSIIVFGIRESITY